MPLPPEPQKRDINPESDLLVKGSSNMLPKRLSIVRKQSASAPPSPLPRLKHLSEDAQPQLPSPQSPSSPVTVTPFLRWFRKQMASSSPLSPSQPQTPYSAALSEAMNDGLPTMPEPAHILPEYHAEIRPPMLSELTRSTLPTSSLTTPADRPGHHPSSSPHASSLDRIPPSAPARTSLDTLRILYNRTILTTPQHQQTRSISIPAAFRNWFQAEPVKDQGEHRSILTEEDQDEDPEVERENIRRKYLAPKNPVVFCHGLLGFDSVTIGPAIAPLEVTHWRGIKEVLQSNGVDVLITRVPATSSPVDRAQVLVKRISEVYPGKKVHLIGHSMGGLDCRYLTTHLVDRNFSVLSITTVGTPHRGSTFADYFLETIGQSRLPQVLAMLDLLPNGDGDGKAFEFLTTENMKKFNENTPDVEGVKYFSYGAEYDPGLIDTWKFSHSVVLEKEGPNDGVVSVMSAHWGTYLGTLEHVNHLDLVGWINTARYKWAELMGNEIKYKPATFYLGITDYLAKVVEGLEPEDMDMGRGKGKRRAETGRGEMLDAVPQGMAGVERKQETASEDGSTTGVHPAKVFSSEHSSAQGKGKRADPILGSGPNRYDGATDTFISTTPEATTSTSTPKPGLDTYPPRQHTPEPKLEDTRPAPIRQNTKAHNDE